MNHQIAGAVATSLIILSTLSHAGFFNSAAEDRAEKTCWNAGKRVGYTKDIMYANETDVGRYSVRVETSKDNVTIVQFLPSNFSRNTLFSCIVNADGQLRVMNGSRGKDKTPERWELKDLPN